MRITLSIERIYTETETRNYMDIYGAFEECKAKHKTAPTLDTAQSLLYFISQARTIPTSLRNRTAARDEALSQLVDECNSLIQGQQ